MASWLWGGRLRRVALLALLTTAACGPDEAGLQDYGALGGDFSLTDAAGRPFRLTELGGSAVLLFFGYTYCPDYCPVTLSRLGAVLDQLGREREGLRIVLVTVDPGRDTPEVLRQYLAPFAVGAIGLTGTQAQIDSVAAQYGVTHERRAGGTPAGYLVDHSTYVFLLDGRGRLRSIFRHGDPVETLVATVRRVLREPGG
ncbi:MAG: SCO family protein [Candidatus Latescibacterota bacterium]